MLPPSQNLAKILAGQYKLPFQYIFHIIRKGFKPIQYMNDDEFHQMRDISAEVFDICLQNKLEINKQAD